MFKFGGIITVAGDKQLDDVVYSDDVTFGGGKVDADTQLDGVVQFVDVTFTISVAV